MRNLKRALSLALASVMLLGMMVVGTSAASYPDVDENDNVEAIEVLNAVSVMIGDQGNFRPDAAVNRHEMATIMAKLVLGVETADNYVGTHPFTDVFPWADKYVAACYENGLVAGTSATTFGGNQPLTAVQAAAMMLRALGYKDLSVGATDWRAPVTAMANQIRLFNGVASNPSEQLTRNQVAQLALNTLKSPMVNLVDGTFNVTSGEGQVIISGGSREYIALSSNEAYARAINDTERAGTSASQISGYTVELGEHLYNGDLKLNDVTDAFLRPARQWEYDGKEIGTYIKEELLDFEKVGEVTGKDLYDVLGKTAIEDYTMSVALDGVDDPTIVRTVRGYDGNNTALGAKHNQDYVFDAADLNRNNKGSVGDTGTGTLTQVFVDPNYDNGGSAKDGRIWIAVINTYLARANQDYDARREELPLNVYSVTKQNGEFVKLKKDGSYTQIRQGVEEFPVIENAEEDDAFLVTLAEGDIQTIVPAEVMSAVTVSSFKSKDNLVVDGTRYNFTTTAGFDADALLNYTGDAVTNLKDTTYNVYLDAYGNVIGVEEVDSVKNYVFLAAIDINDSNLINGTADAKAVFLDGTVDTIRVNVDKSDLAWYDNNGTPGGYNKNSILNTWCTYTVNNNSVYTVKQVMDINAKGDNYTPDYMAGDVNNNNTGLAQYHQTGFANDYTIDKKYITLKGKTGTAGEFARVYGNEDTVYLTAELDYLTNQGGVWGVVKDVDTVTTGAENVNLTVWTDAQAVTEAENARTPNGTLSSGDGFTKEDYATKGVYTLYDDDGIVIAAVVAGEDEGSAKNLVYVHSGSIESESYNGDSASRAAGDGMWTWTRKVISDGQEITLTEVSDGNSDLVKMQKYHWYQIKTNASGEVTGVYRLRDDSRAGNLPIANLDRYDDYALDYHYYDINGNGSQDLPAEIGEIAYTVQNGASTVLYWNEDYIRSTLRMNGRTLYVATDDQTGFIVNSNVRWVVQQWDNNKEETYIDEGTTASGLKNMIDEINRRNTTNNVTEPYSYQVSAVIESGIASSVVIYFNENDYNRPSTSNPTGDTTLRWSRVDEEWTLTIPVDDDKVDDLTTTQIRNYLIDAGCTDIVKTRDGWTFTIDGTQYENQIVKVVGTKTVVTYTVTVAAAANGTASVDVSTGLKGGETVTVTAVPDDGYVLDTISVNGTAITGNTFTMPAADVTVTVTFKEAGDTYTITKGAETNGTFTVADSAEEGETVTVTAVPDDGYELDTITVTDDNGAAVTVTDGSFVMPASNVTVKVTFKAVDPDAPVTVTIVPGNGTAPVDLFRDGEAVLANDIRVGDTISLDPAEVLEVTSGATANDDGTYTVTGDITINLKAGWRYMLGWYWDAEGNMYTPAAAAMAAYARVAAPAWVTGVMQGKVYSVKATLADGTEIVWTLRMNGETGKVQLLPPEGITDEQLASSEEAFAGVVEEDYVIEENNEPAAPEITVDIEGTERPYLFTVNYTGEKPENDAILEAINAALAEAGIEEEASYIAADGVVVADASDKTLGTIGTVGTFKLYINGEEIEGVTLVNNAEENVIAEVPAGATKHLIVEGEGGVAENDTYTTETAMGKTTVTITVDDMKGLDKDLRLVNAYAITLTQDQVTATYTVGNDNDEASDGEYFPDGAKFVFTGYMTIADGSGLKLTLGGETWTADAEKSGTHVWDEITFDAATMLDEDGTIKPVEEATNDLKVVIGSNEYTVQFASADTYFTVNMTRVMPEAGSYIALTEDGKWDNSKDNVWTAAADGNNMKFTPAQDGETNIVDGVLTLKQAVKVTVPADLQYAFDGNDSAVTENEAEFYVSLGSDIQIADKDEVTETSSGPDATDRLVVKYGDDEVLATVTGAYPTWTIPADLLDDWTEEQITAGLSVDMYTARGLIAAVEAEVDKLSSSQTDAKSGDIDCMDNVITATGNLYYVGLIDMTNDKEGENISADKVFRHTVANDLRVFLRELHELGGNVEAENPYATITYQGNEYTWGTAENNATGYVNADGKTLISIVVDQSHRIFGEYDQTVEGDDKGLQEGTWSITIEVDGFDIIFKTVIDKTSEYPEGCGNSNDG